MISSAGMLIPGVEIGPSIKALDVPHPMSVGLEARALGGLLGVSVHKGMLPKVNVGEYGVKMDNFDIGVKVHPFTGSFYVGALYGKQSISVNTSETVNGVPVDFHGEVDSNYITPHIGWQWNLPSGLFLGMSLGWQISSGASTSFRTNQDNNPLITNDPEYQKTKDDVIKAGNDLGNTGLPNVGLLQIGWLF